MALRTNDADVAYYTNPTNKIANIKSSSGAGGGVFAYWRTKIGISVICLSLICTAYHLLPSAISTATPKASQLVGREPKKFKKFGSSDSDDRTRRFSETGDTGSPNNPMDTIENNVFKSAQLLSRPVPDVIQRIVDDVKIEQKRVAVGSLSIFYREAVPPVNNYAKGDILMLHGQAFTSATWLEKKTLQVFAAGGYRVIAVDLPGYGQTAGKTVPNDQKPSVLRKLISSLQLDRPVLVSPSMSGSYSMPFLMTWPELLKAFIAVAPVSSGDYSPEQYEKNTLPTLIIYGERDTSLGVSSASNMKSLKNGRVVKVPNAGHACYLNNPDVFHAACLNFLDLVKTHG